MLFRSLVHRQRKHCCFRLPISVTTRMLDNFDFILLLVDFIEMKPWEKTLADGKNSSARSLAIRDAM
jgi:hypothetical protein